MREIYLEYANVIFDIKSYNKPTMQELLTYKNLKDIQEAYSDLKKNISKSLGAIPGYNNLREKFKKFKATLPQFPDDRQRDIVNKMNELTCEGTEDLFFK